MTYKNLELVDINDIDRAEIARLIKEGCTSGRLDSQLVNKPIGSKYISWELKTKVWVE